MTQKWKWQLYFETFILNLICSEEVEDVREKRERLKWASAKRSCRKGAKMSKMFFRKKLCIAKTYLCESKKITADMMFALPMNKSCKVESCYPIQKCFDRFSERRCDYTLICFHLWQLIQILRQQPKKGLKCHRPHLGSV